LNAQFNPGSISFGYFPGMCQFRVLTVLLGYAMRASLVLAVVGTPILAPLFALVLLSGERPSAMASSATPVVTVLPGARD
ncbi:hypothetical protein, partial [Escherichia coli]|uniref:hypothetical protein n=1 Tax=Escherichia coli TaxID=562 RepID=UPI0013D5F81F